MTNEVRDFSAEIVRASGSFPSAVDALMVLERSLWKHTLQSDAESGLKQHPGKYRKIYRGTLLNSLSDFPAELAGLVVSALEAKELILDYGEGIFGYDLNIFRTFNLVRSLLEPIKPEHDVRYFVMRNIRNVYQCRQTANRARLFYLISGAINNLRANKGAGLGEGGSHAWWNYEQEFIPRLLDILTSQGFAESRARAEIDLFVECCRTVGYVQIYFSRVGCIDLRAASIDAAFLLSNLFGMPTGIRGFDELFGGGGIMFHEKLEAGGSAEPDAASISQEEFIGGRTVLISGRFGTGKSLLSLQLAVEVARKGGLAWVVPLEQSAEECLYTLASIRALPGDGSVAVATDTLEAVEVLRDRRVGRGALIFLPASKDSYEDFLKHLTESTEFMNLYPLKVLCVDPVNSISRDDHDSTVDLRSKILKMIKQIERTGTNIVLVAEEGSDPNAELTFEQNIADTVIRLSVDKNHGYAARFFEIKKSRLQREQRGVHPFSITPGSGFNIFPSSASVSARIRPRGVRQDRRVVQFGLPSIDSILGEKAIDEGDVIVLQGSGGSYKTPLGLIFLLGSDWEKPRSGKEAKSLIVAARDDESTIAHLLSEKFVSQYSNSRKSAKDIRFCALPHGHIYPGYVIQRIEDEFDKARADGVVIDRIMIDDISHWEMSSPFIREDETFGDTLIDFLRRHGVTSLFTCSDFTSSAPSILQRPVVDMANCLIQFDRFEYRGLSHVIVRVQKTRGMRHRGEAFEVSLVKDTFQLKTGSSLLREVRGGEVSPIKIRLFLRSTSTVQQHYNSRILEVIKTVLSRDSRIETQDRIYMNTAMSLISSSVLDELHVIQLDEYQLPNRQGLNRKEGALHSFAPDQWLREWDDFIPSLAERVKHEGQFFAVPYFENVSLLACRSDSISREDVGTWQRMAELCARWEGEHAEGEIFFDFPQTGENINCLFIEILLAVNTAAAEGGECALLKMLASPSAVEAGQILHRLGSRSYQLRNRAGAAKNHSEHVNDTQTVSPEAVVSRVWYSTLHALSSDSPRHDPKRMRMCELPGGVAIAGEWYLGIPVYSAAPDVGLEIIRLLTTKEAELDRLQLGVGLPTRETFYEQAHAGDSVNSSLLSAAEVDAQLLRKQIARAYRRSQCGSYATFSTVLSFHLIKILEITSRDEDEVARRIRLILKSFAETVNFLLRDRGCDNCQL